MYSCLINSIQGKNRSIKLDYKLFENVAVTSQNDMLEENNRK